MLNGKDAEKKNLLPGFITQRIPGFLPPSAVAGQIYASELAQVSGNVRQAF